MRRLIHPIVPLIALVLSLGVPAMAQEPAGDWQGTGTIAGKVLDEKGKGIRNAEIKLRLSGLDLGPDLKSERDGSFTAQGLKAGKWMVQVESKGRSVRRVIVPLGEGETAPPLEIGLGKPMSEKDLREMQKLLSAGDELFKADDYAGARAEYEKVLAERPEFMPIHRSIAFTYGREGQHQEALNHLELALAEDSVNQELLALAISSAIEVGNMEKVNEHLDALFDSGLENSDIPAQMAVALVQQKKSNEAVQVLGRVINEFPTDANPYYFRAMSYLQLEQVPEAKADLQKFVEVAPSSHPQVAQAKDLLTKLP